MDAIMIFISPRECDVLNELVTDGATNNQIAQRLCLSEDTIKTHVKSLLGKTRCNHRTELVVRTMRDQFRFVVRHSNRDRSPVFSLGTVTKYSS